MSQMDRGALETAIRCSQQIEQFWRNMGHRFGANAMTIIDVEEHHVQMTTVLEGLLHMNHHPREAGPPPGAVVD